jgi:glycosyltransferase involved in cell wall biosynthesis
VSAAPVSVVVPCYRCAETLPRALASVAAQTVLPAEVILVDDGSRDGTLQCMHSLAQAHPAGWIRTVSLPENRGAASARNAGWSLATQPYVAFLDADDAWHPRKIELQYGFMAGDPEVALCGHGHEVVGGTAESRGPVPGLSSRRVSRLSLLLSNPFITPSVMLKRDLPRRFLADRRHVDDHLLWLELAYAGFRIVKLEAKLAFTHKALYGEGGLSAELWKMEKAELENYRILRSSGRIGAATAAAVSAYSLAKFARRLCVVGARRLAARVSG